MNASKHILLTIGLCCTALGAALAQKADTVTVQVKNEQAINTKGLEFSPTFYEDGIVFISTNTAGLKKATDPALKLPAMSILRSRRNLEGELQAPEPFAQELSTLNHEGPVCFDRTTETVYFSKNAQEKGKDVLAKDKQQKQRIYFSKKVNGAWSEPVALPFNDNQFDDWHPAISIDGDKLYFSSNRPGGLGGWDIYVSYKVGESWSEPVNLGATVNTAGNEGFPFIHADNTLYYASDAMAGGMGGFDLYYTVPDGNSWTKPVNLGAPFNSANDDIGLIVDLNKINGYFSSNGAGGLGADDIFSFHTEGGNLDDYLLQNQRLPDRKLDLAVKVTDKATGAVIAGAEVRVVNLDKNNVIGRDEAGNLIVVQNENGQDVMRAMPQEKAVTGNTDATGRFATEVPAGNYAIFVSQKGYTTKQLKMPITKPGNEIPVALDRLVMAGKVHWNASVFNYLTNEPLPGSNIVLTNKTTGQRDTVIADDKGMVDYWLNQNTRYKVELYQGNRLVGASDITTQGADPNTIMTQNLTVAPLLPGTVIELPNIYYNFNDATLRPDARKDLDLMVAIMQQHPAITVELASHTDCRGSQQYNETLSQRRANGVVDYLVSRGVSRERLKPVGYGESEPRNECRDGVTCTEEEHARNRRTEVRIITGVQAASMLYVDGQLTEAPGSSATDPSPATAQHSTGGSTTAVRSGSADAYYVIAGSFLMENRAQNRLSELKAAGFEEAEIVQFPNSTFYSVSVRKCATRAEANAVSKQVESKKKIETFIRTVPRLR